VSTMCMPLTRKILRVLGWAVAGLFVIVLILAAAIRVDQYLLRRKAERLLTDLKSLEMRKSTYQDARRVMDRWDEELHQEGPCQPFWCDVGISLRGVFLRHPTLFANRESLVYVFRLLGARPAMIDGSIRVRKNIVWGKGIRAIIERQGGRTTDGHRYDYTLVGEARSGSPSTVISSLHPEYRVDSRSGCCIDARVVFTPYADPAEVTRLMDINFSCLESWHPCETKADILPTAWNEYTAEEKSAKNSVQQTCSPEVIRVLSRESKRVVIGEVTKLAGTNAYICSSQPPCVAVPSTELGEVTVLLKGDFKPWNPHFPLAPEDRSFSDSLPLKEKLGDRYVFFFEHPIVEYRVDRDPVCTPLPATDQNIEAVRRGVAEDWADHNDEFLSPFPGLGDLNRPTIDVR